MTLSTLNNRNSYTGDGVTTTFAFPQYFLLVADLVVKLLDTNNVETSPVLNTDYTLSGAGVPGGGTVTFAVAPAAGSTVTIYRSPSPQQDLNLQENDSFPAEEVEKRFDRDMMINQRVLELLARSLTLPESDATRSMALPLLASLKNMYLGFDANGLPVGLSAIVPGVTASAYIQTLLIAATAAASRTILGFNGGSGAQIPASLIPNAILTPAMFVDSANPSGVSAVKIATYAIQTSDGLVQLDPTTPFTATLPTAVGASGKVYEIVHVGAAFCTATIATTSAQTIKHDGMTSTTTTLDSPGESIKVKSDGVNWVLLRRYIPSVITAYNVTSAFTGFGTPVTPTANWQRIGGSIRILAQGTTGNTTATEARLALPGTITGAMDAIGVVGAWALGSNAAISTPVLQENAKAYMTFGIQAVGNAGLTKGNGSLILGNGVAFAINALIPITGWKG